MHIRLRRIAVLISASFLCAAGRSDQISRPSPPDPWTLVKEMRLERYGVETTLTGMVKGLQSPKLTVRLKCIEGLGYVGGVEEVAPLKATCANPDTQLRAMERLYLISTRLASAKREELRAYLIDTANSAWDHRSGNLYHMADLAAVVELVGGRSHPEAFLAGLKDMTTRGMVLFRLSATLGRERLDGRPPSIDWVPSLAAVLADSSSRGYERMLAADCLANVGGKAAEDTLRAAVAVEKDGLALVTMRADLNRLTKANAGSTAVSR